MAYLALYRKYRPSGFDKLIGQDHIVRILKNQISEDRVGHAYLFCGTRGTGKTSAAKIFARAINCLDPKDGSPCGVCSACLALSQSSNMDIMEIDAASNNRVDEIRDIREKVQYSPVSARYKVYIIDEAHMLTDSAYNALLKTLEEPPSHAVFILATTEPQKLPATILSRCMRFDFKMVSEKDLTQLICGIFDEIKLKYEKDAVAMIAKAGEGSVRDSLSIADKCVSYQAGKLTYQDVLEVLGSADKSKIIRLCENILQGNIGGVLSDINELVGLGKSISVLCKDMSSLFRDLCIIKSVESANDILLYPALRFEQLTKMVKEIDINLLLRCLELFTKLDGELRHSLSARVILETTALKCTRASNDISYDGLLRRITRLEAQLASGAIIQKNASEKEEIVKATSTDKKRNIAASSAFAELVKNLRKSTNQLLFKTIQDVRGDVRGEVLCFIPQTKVANEMLKNEQVLNDYKKILLEIGYGGELAIQDFQEAQEDTEKSQIEQLEKEFDTTIEIK